MHRNPTGGFRFAVPILSVVLSLTMACFQSQLGGQSDESRLAASRTMESVAFAGIARSATPVR